MNIAAVRSKSIIAIAYLIVRLFRLYNGFDYYLVELQWCPYQHCASASGKTEGVLPKDAAHLEKLRNWYPWSG